MGIKSEVPTQLSSTWLDVQAEVAEAGGQEEAAGYADVEFRVGDNSGAL